MGDTGVVQKLGASQDELGGLGLKGMRERIGAVGGTLTAGRRERGGFMVRATVPLGSAPVPENDTTEAAEPRTSTMFFKGATPA